jgi:cyclophilin family peptidyl-prolyl cis-trans isomerase
MRVLPAILVALSLILFLSVSAGCGSGEQPAQSAQPGGAAGVSNKREDLPDKKAAAAEVAEEIAEDIAEEAQVVTATLTYIDDTGKKTMEVPYLSPGSKIATVETEKGIVKIELWEDRAPNTVVNFVHLANSGRYDGVEFHRVITGFMAQTGDVSHKRGYGGPGYTIPAEFNKDLSHLRGVVSMARGTDPDSGGSQFFIMFDTAARLDGQYAAFGEVIEGMEVIDSIKKGDSANNGSVEDPDKIVRLRVESVPEE